MSGTHIKILFEAPEHRLKSEMAMQNLLITIVDKVGMRALGEPVIYDVPTQVKNLGSEPFEDEGGVTGVVVLSTSHCAFHTWPLRTQAVGDVYSCRAFDPDVVLSVVKDIYRAFRWEVHDVSHALHWTPTVVA